MERPPSWVKLSLVVFDEVESVEERVSVGVVVANQEGVLVTLFKNVRCWPNRTKGCVVKQEGVL